MTDHNEDVIDDGDDFRPRNKVCQISTSIWIVEKCDLAGCSSPVTARTLRKDAQALADRMQAHHDQDRKEKLAAEQLPGLDYFYRVVGCNLVTSTEGTN